MKLDISHLKLTLKRILYIILKGFNKRKFSILELTHYCYQNQILNEFGMHYGESMIYSRLKQIKFFYPFLLIIQKDQYPFLWQLQIDSINWEFDKIDKILDQKISRTKYWPNPKQNNDTEQIHIQKWEPIYKRFIQIILNAFYDQPFTISKLAEYCRQKKLKTEDGFWYFDTMLRYRIKKIYQNYPQLFTIDLMQMPYLWRLNISLINEKDLEKL